MDTVVNYGQYGRYSVPAGMSGSLDSSRYSILWYFPSPPQLTPPIRQLAFPFPLLLTTLPPISISTFPPFSPLPFFPFKRRRSPIYPLVRAPFSATPHSEDVYRTGQGRRA